MHNRCTFPKIVKNMHNRHCYQDIWPPDSQPHRTLQEGHCTHCNHTSTGHHTPSLSQFVMLSCKQVSYTEVDSRCCTENRDSARSDGAESLNTAWFCCSQISGRTEDLNEHLDHVFIASIL